jgi:ABC-type lipoprotein export system ATPase subunit
MNNPEIAIIARDVVKTFDRGRTRALDGASLTVHRGEFVAVVGPSGCGKSTLMHLIAALDAPDSGTITVNGRDIASWPGVSQYRAREIGLVFQLHNLLPSLTASENVQIPMFEGGMSSGERHARAERLLEIVGMRDKSNNLPTQLSGGERQRVAFARALANDPPILLADEPTGSLDSKTSKVMLDLLEQLQRDRGLTIVLITHDPTVAERADRIIHMLDGKIVDAGTSISWLAESTGASQDAGELVPPSANTS